MKRKITFVSFCLILLLIFTTLSYGDIDPKYKARARPNQELLSPPIEDESEDVLLLVIPGCDGFSFIIYLKNNSSKESPVSQSLKKQEAKSRLNSGKKDGKLTY